MTLWTHFAKTEYEHTLCAVGWETLIVKLTDRIMELKYVRTPQN